MRSYIVGTAGHIDHGKTALVKALTGVDTDRLKEEKRRGITIELGFAHLVIDEAVFGIVDVPGHERFIKSMVAGAGGIDLVILVIAADEGVMPQTREHLDICRLLGVRRGLVALTKTDLVDAEWLALVEEDLRASVLEGTFLEGAEIVRCSAVDGLGIDRLRARLLAIAGELPPRSADGVLRLPLDRVFTIKGFGTVVTGSLLGGQVARGDEVEILPSDLTGAVRRIQVHGDEVDKAVAGQRTAINLGGLDRQAVARGEVLAHVGTLAASPMIDVELALLPTANRNLAGRAKVLFHLGTRQQEATCVLLEPRQIGPGETALAQLRFDRPVVAQPGDRFIVRGFVKQDNHGTTIGGGEVLRVLASKLLPRDRAGVALLAEVAGARGDRERRTALEVLGAARRGLRRAELQQRLALTPRALDRVLERLLNERRLVRWDRSSGAVVHREVFDRLRARALEIVDRFHDDNPVKPGIGRAELGSRLGAGVDPRLAVAIVERLQREGKLEVKGEHCLRPGHRARVDAELGPLTDAIVERYRAAALAPPRQAELEASLAAPADTVRAALKALTTDGALVRVGPLLFHREAVDELERRLRAHLQHKGEITPGEFKALVGQSRKFSIPLAEHFDARGLTLRVGDVRRLRGS